MNKAAKKTLFAGVAIVVVAGFTAWAAMHHWLIPNHSNSTRSGFSIAGDVKTKGGVPLFELPWKKDEPMGDRHLAAVPGSFNSGPATGAHLPPGLAIHTAAAGEKDPEKALTFYFDQICKGNAPSLADWQTLALSKPPRIEKYLDLPFGKGHFVMSLCQDQVGGLWIGTEGEGLWRYDPNAALALQWKHFKVEDGLGDDYIYALAADHQGRIWAGHLNHGVSVFNGQRWQNYNVARGLPREGELQAATHNSLAGPLGERLFAIAVCPTDGDVWMASSGGLSRYNASKNKWANYNRMNGLPCDLINAISFDDAGTLYLGTQCDGIVIAHATDEYQKWEHVTAPDVLLPSSSGSGLCSNLINALLVAHNQVLYAATNTGLSWSCDRGRNWQFIRGADWKNKLLRSGISSIATIEGASTKSTLSEDYCTAIGEDMAGQILVGHRESKADAIDTRTAAIVPSALPQVFIESCLLSKNFTVVGSYSNGAICLSSRPNATLVGSDKDSNPTGLSFPESASSEDLSETVASVVSHKFSSGKKAIFLGDDWSTSGDWCGRYGRQWACLCGMAGPNIIWGTNPTSVEYCARIGTKAGADDVVRYWIQTLYTNDSRCLEMPAMYLQNRVAEGLTTLDMNRRDSSIDDHGEEYARQMNGPDLFIGLKIPNGRFILSFYEVNGNGRLRNASERDYTISIRENSSGKLSEIGNFQDEQELCRARVQNFYTGVYKRFAIAGPITLTARIARSYSLNTILAGIFLDPIDIDVPIQGVPNNDVEDFSKIGKLKIVDAENTIMMEKDLEFWAIAHQRAGVNLIRKIIDTKSTGKIYMQLLASSFFQTGQYNQCERLLRSEGRLTFRDIEVNLNEDGLSSSNTGDLELIQSYIRMHLAN